MKSLAPLHLIDPPSLLVLPEADRRLRIGIGKTLGFCIRLAKDRMERCELLVLMHFCTPCVPRPKKNEYRQD